MSASLPSAVELGSDGAGDGLPAGSGLSDRFTAVARLIQIGSARTGGDGFDPGLLQDAEGLLARAGERLRLSAEHTIVVLAGGTGSGKSSLFNRLAGAEFSAAGAIRPVTRQPHACVWGMTGAGSLLDWLGVQPRYRYARSSALDEGERSLAGLLLLDLPDHDSVLAGRASEVDRLLKLADLMVWVLDPQKYADAAVHSRYLVPMAGHSAVIAVVLNQIDLLGADQVDDCEADLRRLLDTEGLPDVRVVGTSALTGAGMDELRKVLLETVLARQASLQRIEADVDAIAARFGPYAGDESAGAVAATLPAASAEALAEAFARAAGVAGVGSALQSARELKAVDHVGWPVAWLAERVLQRDPVRKIRLGTLWDELRGTSAGSGGAQQADIDTAVTVIADEAGRGLPAPWPGTVRAAARSRAADVPGELGAAIAKTLPPENSVLPWWRAVAIWQGLLLGAAAVTLGWLVALLVLGVFGAAPHAPSLVSDVSYLPWVVLLLTAVLVLGWLTASGCMNLAVREAGREREQVERRMREEIALVAQRLVVTPAEQELSEFARFREELKVARGLA
ncbi:MAG TPA: GTPase [Streptosporangiaceae bacterium]|jgi:GTP-binding protein EngB required for normal cell division